MQINDKESVRQEILALCYICDIRSGAYIFRRAVSAGSRGRAFLFP